VKAAPIFRGEVRYMWLYSFLLLPLAIGIVSFAKLVIK
jgi:hypothetical protein